MSSDLTNKLSSIIIKRFQTTNEAFLYSAVLALKDYVYEFLFCSVHTI